MLNVGIANHAFEDCVSGQPQLSAVNRSLFFHPFIFRERGNMGLPKVTMKCRVKSLEFMELQEKIHARCIFNYRYF